MKQLLSPLFIISITLFTVHQIMQKGFSIQLDLLDSYLDNLVAMPVILTLLQAEKIWLFNKPEDYRLSILQIITTTVYIIIISEILFPILSKAFTSDWIDVFFYVIGSLIFYLTNRKENL